MPAAVSLPLLDLCHFLREAKPYLCSDGLKWAGRGQRRNNQVSSSALQWLIPRLLKGQTFMLMNVNALSSESHTLPFPNLPHQPMKQQGLQAGLIRAGRGKWEGEGLWF